MNGSQTNNQEKNEKCNLANYMQCMSIFGKRAFRIPGMDEKGYFGHGMIQNYSMDEFPKALLDEIHKDSQLLHDHKCN